jgi:transposase-like protein
VTDLGTHKRGQVVDILLRDKRDRTSAEAFFRQALSRTGTRPHTVISDHHQPCISAFTPVNSVISKSTKELRKLLNSSLFAATDNFYQHLHKFLERIKKDRQRSRIVELVRITLLCVAALS